MEVPMSFWDRFVLVLYFGLAWHLPVGRDAALRILDIALSRGRLSLAGLNDTSLLLLLALLPDTSPHRQPVQSLVASRQLHVQPAQIIQLLQAAAPPRLADVVELGRAPGTHPGTVAFLQALLVPNRLGVIENLRLYLARLNLLDPNSPPVRSLVTSLVGAGSQRYVGIPLGTVDYLACLYREVRLQTRAPGQPLPSGFPPGTRPAWFQALSPDEQRFLDTCMLHLPEQAVDLVYLHYYARLSVDQIVGALRLVNPAGAADAVARRLEQAWNVIL
jgi:hypothetical protein